MKLGIPALEVGDWNKVLQHQGGSILQSSDWASYQAALKREVIYDSGTTWQWSATIRRSNGLVYVLANYGPVAKDKTAMKDAMHSIMEAGREVGADFVRVEPPENGKAELEKMGAVKISELDPSYTRVIDLSKAEEELRSDLASGHRNLINGTERRGIKIHKETSEETLKIFDSMLRDTAKHSQVRFWSEDYFKAMLKSMPDVVTIYIADVNKEPVASALFYDWGDTRYYAHAGAFQQKNREAKASVSLVWQAIIGAKVDGKKKFDLWGVAPEGDESHHLARISRFKAAFGGEIVEYGGTWDIPINKPKYSLYTLYRRLRGL